MCRPKSQGGRRCAGANRRHSQARRRSDKQRAEALRTLAEMPAHQAQAAADPGTPPEVLEQLFVEHPELAPQLALNTAASPSLLQRLSKHPKARYNLAANHACPPEILVNLCDDPTLRHRLAANPSTPPRGHQRLKALRYRLGEDGDSWRSGNMGDGTDGVAVPYSDELADALRVLRSE